MQSNNIINKSISLEDIFSLFINKNEEDAVKSMELNSLYSIYLKMQETLVRPDTISMYNSHIPSMIKYFAAHEAYETKHISQKLIDSYVRYSIGTGVKNVTINKRVCMFTAMLKRTAKAGLITMPVYEYEHLKEDVPKIQIINKEDVQKILDQIDNMKLSHQVIIFILLTTGIRRNEIVNIKTHNIDFRNKSIYLEFTKCGKPRYCYFGDKLESLLKLLIQENGSTSNPYLFPVGESEHLDKQSVSSMLHKLKRDLKIDVLSSHKFRHLYATALLKNGADIFTVKQLLGHSKLENTQRYLDFTNEELKQNNFKYNPLNNFK